jgi:hypothetical protein
MRRLPWTDLPDAELLDWRICDLGLELESSPLAARRDDLHAELERAGLRFRPYIWLSTDWFTPDSCTGFAVPFYLAHPRLVRLERNRMLQVEGGTREECMKIMRHEAAHALDNAYGLRRRKRWRELFGSPGEPYEASYTPDPTSRAHVIHLDYWYSQSHPLEDWAETFAVWLRPGSRWRSRYASWPALEKLEYVDALAGEVADATPRRRTRHRVEPLREVRTTLREYYGQKQDVYLDSSSPALDEHLERIFSGGESGRGRPRAAAFLRRNRVELVRRVSRATGQHRYLLDHVVREMIERCQLRDLRVSRPGEDALVDAAVVLTSLSTPFLYGAHPNYHR